jgi:hypothetical protein
MKLLIIILLLTLSSLSFSKINLTSEELKNLASGNLIVRTKAIKDAPWPEVTVYSLIKASPKEAVAIFAAYHDQKNFTPGVIKSNPVKIISPLDIHVSYEMSVPWPLSNAIYTTGNVLGKLKDGGYIIKWYFVESNSTENNSGEANFVPFKDISLFKYKTLIHPKSIFASIFEGFMLDDVQESVKITKKHIESLSSAGGPTVAEYIKLIDGALNGKDVWKKHLFSK